MFMNKQECDILKTIFETNITNQRALADACGHSLGVVNRSIKNLQSENLLDEVLSPTKKAIEILHNRSPKRAIILAAGYGMRMVPINMETPKGLLEVDDEPLIERIIKQLHEVNIQEIYIVVGFMKEQYEYLMDEYDVHLIVNEEYSGKNNLHSLCLAEKYISNAYIIPCDVWSSKNPFQKHELYSWYMVSDFVETESDVRVNRKMELSIVPKNEAGNAMIGISYLVGDEAKTVRDRLINFDANSDYDNCFWEETLYEKDKMIVQAQMVRFGEVVEINTYEQLREIDENSNQLKSDALDIICEALNVNLSEIVDITVLKKGMTNRSFLFSTKDKKYIMRIPGEGTEKLINRKEEAAVYSVIQGKNICDNVVYMNPDNGYKITEFLNNARVCDAENVEDLEKCMKKLRQFHSEKLKVGHEFDIFGQIEFYESLWDGKPSVYRDYEKTKQKVFELKHYIDACMENNKTEKVLTHIDAVPDNFMFTEDGDIRLIDWEYAGMQDPHVDVAMFCIYSLYDREQVDRLIDIYFEGTCQKEIRIKIYCYIAACGFLWSNWCEYKRNLGVEFGEYSLRQYRYAKDYYKLVKEELQAL